MQDDTLYTRLTEQSYILQWMRGAVTKAHGSENPPFKDESGLGVPHMRWMIDEIPTFHDIQKQHRWLGYAQCLGVINGLWDLDGVRTATRDSLGGA